MLNYADFPFGYPSLELCEDEVFTVVQLLADAAEIVRPVIAQEEYEVPINIRMRKALRKVKRDAGLNNIEIHGEDEVINNVVDDPDVIGRIDITVRFLQQFGDENSYLAIECKRLIRGDSTLNLKYIDNGLDRFVNCKYASGHKWGIMVGYLMNPPLGDTVHYLNRKICERYGANAAMNDVDHAEITNTLALKISKHHQILIQNDINVFHVVLAMGS